MLREIGYASFEEMFSHIPDEVVMLRKGSISLQDSASRQLRQEWRT